MRSGESSLQLSPASPPLAREEALFVERVQLIFRNGPTSLVVHVALGLILAGVLWVRVPHAPLTSWVAVLLGISILRASLLFCFRRYGDELTLATWLLLYGIGAVAAAGCWGGAIFFFSARPDLITAVIITFAVGGLSIGGFAAMGSMLRLYVPFLLAMIVPVTVHFLWLRPEPGVRGLGLMLIAFALAMTALAAAQRTVLNRAFTLAAHLAEEKARVEETSRAKSDFLAYISHEIRTPMNGVLGTAELLLDSELNADQRHLINTILRSGQSLLTVINDVLDISKIEAGKLSLEQRPFDPALTVINQVELYAEQAQRKQLNVKTDIAPNVPRRVLGDQQRFGQIVANLLSNALKFTERGGVDLQLHARPVIDNANALDLILLVRDTGAGIAPSALARIFETYEQGDISTSRKFGGSGLGLAICKNLAEMMGGSIDVQSQLGQGSTFTLRLRVGVIEHAERLAQRADAQVQSGIQRLRGHVLLAEDNLVNQELTARMLESLGCTWQAVDNGVAAVEMAQQQTFDLILMDGDMPLLSGIDATLRVRSWERDVERMPVPIIAITANAMMEDRQRYLDVGMNDYLIKPFSRQQLFDALCVYLPTDSTITQLR